MKKKSNYLKIAAALSSCIFLFSCNNNTVEENSVENTEVTSTIGEQEISAVVSELVTYEEEDYTTDWESDNPIYIDLNGTEASFDSSASVASSGGTVTIRTAGVYVLSGSLEDGQIIVDAEDSGTVRLVLNGVDINNNSSSAILIKNADSTIITLAEGTENELSDGESYESVDNSGEPNGTIFSKDDLTINGTGSLKVQANYNNAIVSKDELRIMEGTLEINSVDDGILGRDIVAIKTGTISIEAGGDGIKSTNTDASKGIVALEAGTYNIAAGNDGIQAESSLYIVDGTYTISTGGGSPETIEVNEGMGMGQPWGGNASTETEEEEDTSSYKGLKANVELAIGDGTFTIDSLDDAIHSDNSVTITGGEMELSSGDDGIHADASILTRGGRVNITKSYEGIESEVVTIEDGEITLTASDDGVNVSGGADGSGMEMQSSGTGILNINGGYVSVNSEGDGLDANGSINITDGIVLVNGPTNDGNAALDYDGTFLVSGGTVIAAGSSGMAQSASEDSEQNSLLMTFPEVQEAGTLIHLEDSDGNTIVTFAPEKVYQSVFISSPTITKDTSYSLFVGGSTTGDQTNGLYTEGEYSEGTKIVDFTISDTITWLDESGITEGGNTGFGGGGQNGGGRPSGGFNGSSDENRP